MESLIVLQNPANWSFDVAGVRVAAARDYLTDTRYSKPGALRVYNLCRSYRYLSLGYYVSLLAEARGHRPLPTVNTIQDVRMQAIIRIAGEDLDALVQKSLKPVRSSRFTLSIYFGRNLAKRYDRLSTRLFNQFPAPLLRAQFVRTEKWELQSLYTISSSDVQRSHRPFVEQAASQFFAGRGMGRRSTPAQPYDLAILFDPDDKSPPSDKVALRRFAKASRAAGMRPISITRDDYGRLAEFDGLFIRDTTYVNHYTYRFASRAAAEGIVVIDDPRSIVRCTNKVYLAELFARHGVRIPETRIVYEEDLGRDARRVTYPCILKRPDSSFSHGVIKVQTPEEFIQKATEMLEHSDLVIAQEFIPTPFDWRVGVLDQRPLYVCRYWMARKHWQIIQYDGSGRGHCGKVEALPLDDVPKNIVSTALRAANLIGDGFYGVDVKEIGGKAYVMEINDNPSVDSGCEDGVLGPRLYESIMSVFRKRIEIAKKSGVRA